MRCSISSPDYSYTLKSVAAVGGLRVKEAHRCGVVFADLSEEQVRILLGKQATVKPVRSVYSTGIKAPTEVSPSGGRAFSGSELSYAAAIWELRNFWSPPLSGSGYEVALLDSGIRRTHEGLIDKVSYERNFSLSPTLDDIYNHGSSCAWCICGGELELEEQGSAPGAKVLNLKVLNDDGIGNDESVVMALEHVIYLKTEGGHEDIVAVNLSLGAPDDGDPNDPMRLACKAVWEAQMTVFVAAGNDGPDPGTVSCPASEPPPPVIAVGSVNPTTFEISSFSSRGPTKEKKIKPDLVFFGDDMTMGDARGDSSFSTRAGTSFATAWLSGLALNGMEAFERAKGAGIPLPGISEELMIGGSEYDIWFFEHADEICSKPEGRPSEKDNTYGYGIPVGTAIQEAFMAGVRPGVVISGLVGLVTPIIGIAMIGMMISGMTKGISGGK